jgi:hypothetical protein
MYKCADTTVSAIPSTTMVSPMSYKVCSVVILSTYLSVSLDDTFCTKLFVLNLVYLGFFLALITIVVRYGVMRTRFVYAG